MELRIDELCCTYSGDAEALAAFDQPGQEPELHRRHSDCCAYEVFVTCRE